MKKIYWLYDILKIILCYYHQHFEKYILEHKSNYCHNFFKLNWTFILVDCHKDLFSNNIVNCCANGVEIQNVCCYIKYNLYYGCTEKPKWKFLAEAEQNETLNKAEQNEIPNFSIPKFSPPCRPILLFFSLLHKLNSQNQIFTLLSCFLNH